jgi:predicted dinucleotide-binding enzyme
MRVAVLGTGNLGRAVGVRLAEVGQEVYFGARRPEEAEFAASLTQSRAQAGSNEQAAAFGEVVFWMMRETYPRNVLTDPALLDGKVIVDVNLRPFAGESDSSPWFSTALGEELQANLPNSRYVKALTTVSMFTFDVPIEALRTAKVQTFMAGRDPDAKRVFATLMSDAGLQAVDIGEGPVAIRAAEALGNVLRLMMGNGRMSTDGRFAVARLPDERLDHIGGHRPSSYIKGSVHEKRVPHLIKS